ncbi:MULTISPECIES: hypothetical protein [Cytobacillus]|jgi:hypothetical protein|uniref:Uncharacterized protein n=2 Tax=Cytobacillus oceanisediminis TaxID=665099 RepID=A0A160MGK3_9BACI|nr:MULTISPECIES: hypothetical protein [Cytobacillus]MBY0158952.1 hypothetical protein [Cytobacillus firmus]AND41818.1 hypothetical protein A361_22515 [Cytobacillus oceanisediminis 2691]MCM3242578.1 hypothetical protein [Cytobacillus oceanisediminis]MCM3392934.1 hypothetical protein [Cytobacillus oceanisediminis]MCM3530050.1 hypothetical protein [Cytobacillus oceanisediminis]
MDMDSSILDLQSFRKAKQLQGENNALRLYTLSKDYTERTANIREKVRAKHLFRKTLGLASETAFSPIQQEVFQDWFLFDYKTIQGSTMFSLFLKNNARQLSESDLIQGALFLTSVMEPIRILDVSQKKISASGVEDSTSFLLSQHGVFRPELSIGWYFIRRIPIQMYDLPIGPFISIQKDEGVHRLTKAFSKAKLKVPDLTWRAFLKSNVLFFISGV